MATGRSVDDLVHSANLYIPRHILLHGYILPFLILYGVWSYCWLAIFDTDFHFEVGYICLAVVGLLQLLTVLCCHWSVHVKCALTCKYVGFKSRSL
jgi:manganese-transporting P-type ATPase